MLRVWLLINLKIYFVYVFNHRFVHRRRCLFVVRSNIRNGSTGYFVLFIPLIKQSQRLILDVLDTLLWLRIFTIWIWLYLLIVEQLQYCSLRWTVCLCHNGRSSQNLLIHRNHWLYFQIIDIVIIKFVKCWWRYTFVILKRSRRIFRDLLLLFFYRTKFFQRSNFRDRIKSCSIILIINFILNSFCDSWFLQSIANLRF